MKLDLHEQTRAPSSPSSLAGVVVGVVAAESPLLMLLLTRPSWAEQKLLATRCSHWESMEHLKPSRAAE